MPTNGENFDELLSAFLDGELSDDELKSVEVALGRSEPLRRKLNELSDVRNELQSFFRSSPQAGIGGGLPGSLAARVIAEAQRQAVQGGLPEDHHVRLAERVEIANISEKKAINARKFTRWGILAAGLAATVALVVFGPGLFRQPGSNELANVPADEVLGPENSDMPRQAQYVSEINFKGKFLFVVDVELAPSARENEILESMMAQAGLLNSEPIVGSFDIRQALNKSRSIVTPESDGVASNAEVFFLRADLEAFRQLLDAIYFDQESFPKVAFDLAIDNPTARLMAEIARSTGDRFTVDTKFVAPVVVEIPGLESPANSSSELKSLPAPGQHVSAKVRQKGFGPAASVLPPEDLSSVLLLVR